MEFNSVNADWNKWKEFLSQAVEYAEEKLSPYNCVKTKSQDKATG